MQKYLNGARTLRGDAIKNASITVRDLAGTLATIYALKQRCLYEASPVMRWAMGKVGIVLALGIIKAAPLVLIFRQLQENILMTPLWTVIYLGIAGWNIRVIYKNSQVNP